MAITRYTMAVNAPVVDAEPLSLPGPILRLTFRSNSNENWPVGSHLSITLTGSSGSVLVFPVTLNKNFPTATLSIDTSQTVIAPDFVTITSTNDRGWTDPDQVYAYAVDSGIDNVPNFSVFGDFKQVPSMAGDTSLISDVYMDQDGNAANVPFGFLECPLHGPVREVGVRVKLLTFTTLTGVTIVTTQDDQNRGIASASIISGLTAGNFVGPGTLNVLYKIDPTGAVDGDIASVVFRLFATGGTGTTGGNWLTISCLPQFTASRPKRRRG